MVYSGQPTTATVVAAGLIRLTQLGAHLKYLRGNYQPITEVVLSIIDLRQKLEAMALTTDLGELNILKGYVQETYGLLALYTDPLLRPQEQDAPAVGATVKPKVLRVQGGKALFVQGDKVIALSYVLVPYTAPAPRLLRVQGGRVLRIQGGKALLIRTAPVAPVAVPVMAPVTTPVLAPAAPATTAPTGGTPFVNQWSVTVTHNLGRFVTAVVYDTNNEQIEGVENSTLNSITVSFSEPVSGTIYIY